MINTINKCGCSAYNLPNNPHSQCSHSDQPKLCPSEKSEDEVSCDCECSSNNVKKEQKSPLKSEIVEKGLPYKEIEAIINNNRMVVRMQIEGPEPEFEPTCDCISPIGEQSNDDKTESLQKNDVTFQKSSQGNKTISLYPQPDQKFSNRSERSDDGKKSDNNSSPSTVNPEENPNIFVLKIKKKRENGEKKYNFNIEYLIPRPWRNQKCR